MNCTKILDNVYDVYEQDDMPLLLRIRIGLHLLICPDCARKIERFEMCRDILRSDCMPSPPNLEDSIMAMIGAGAETDAELQEPEAIPGGFSTRGWVIAGLIMLVSLATVFFGLEFGNVALAAGMSFMIPVGITIGIVLTSYGALFIGSHLKELSFRFRLR